MQLISFFKTNKVLLIIHFVYAAIWFIMLPGGIETGDASIKFMQVRDFVFNHYSSLTCEYPGRDIDFAMRFFPLSDTFFFYVINNECYYVFPFYFTIILAPFYSLFGSSGPYLLPLFSSLFIFSLFWNWSAQLGLSDKNRKWYLLYLAFGTGIMHFSNTLSETNINVALVCLGYYWVWKYTEEKNLLFLILSSIPFGLTVSLRQESLPIPFLLGFFLLVTRNTKFFHTLLFLFVYSLFAFTWAWINYLIFQNPMGLRGVQQGMEATEGSFLYNRFLMFLEIFFYGRFNVGLVFAYPILLSILLFYSKIKTLRHSLIPILLCTASFLFLIPIATITYQGVGWGTRFVLSSIPFLLLIAFLLFEKKETESPNSRLPIFLKISITWSILGALVFLNIFRVANLQSKKVNNFIANSTNEVIVLLADDLEAGIQSSFYNKRVFKASTKRTLKKLFNILSENNIKEVSLVYHSEYFFPEKEYFTEDINALFETISTKESKEARIKIVKIKDN